MGEPATGKSSIIKAFLEYDDGSSTVTPKISNSDFSLKIVKVDGEKMRL